MKLSIIVPCYNESNNLDRLVDAFRAAIPSKSEIELLLVDNGSQDDSPQRLTEILSRPENSFARAVRVEVNQGYGHGILFGLRQAAGEFLAWTHADLQTPPADVLHALQEISQRPEPSRALIRGRRQGRPWFDGLFTSAMGWVASAALGSSLVDVNAQPKLFHRSLLDELQQAPHDFTLDLFLLHRANQLGLDVCAVDVRFDRRTAGQAKGGGTLWGKYKLSRRTLQQIWTLRQSLKQQALPTTGAASGGLATADDRQDAQPEKRSAA